MKQSNLRSFFGTNVSKRKVLVDNMKNESSLAPSPKKIAVELPKPSTESVPKAMKFELDTAKIINIKPDINEPHIPYSSLCKTFEAIEATTKRLEIQALLKDFFSNVIQSSPSSLTACVYLCLNKVFLFN